VFVRVRVCQGRNNICKLIVVVFGAMGPPHSPFIVLTKLMGKQIPATSPNKQMALVSIDSVNSVEMQTRSMGLSSPRGGQQGATIGNPMAGPQSISTNQYDKHDQPPVPLQNRNSYNQQQAYSLGPSQFETVLSARNGSGVGTNQNQIPVLSEEQMAEGRRALREEEGALLRECLYSLQGIDGERIRYYHRDISDNSLPDMTNYEGVRAQSTALSSQNLLYNSGGMLESRLGSGAMDALRICGEAGWLYSRVKSYIQDVQHDETKGVVARAFAEALAEQLRDYHSLLTTYEAKLPDFTLRQLLVELRSPTSRLKILAMVTDGLRQFRGGHLLSALHKHSLHGNTNHATLVQSILYKASRPWFEILHMWTTQGVLSDPWNEFFVVEDANVDDKHLWKDKYRINEDQVPTGILDQALVKPSFTVGKGINFIRRCLLDGQWTMRLQNDTNPGRETLRQGNFQDLGYRYKPYEDGNSENVILQKTLTRAATLVHSHILRTLKEDNSLMHHLFALKQFLLLGQGDFFSALMEGLHNEFSDETSINEIYKHSLLSIVEGALRSTNAKYMPQYIVDRLQVELILGPEDETDDVWNPPQNRANDENNQERPHRSVYDMFLLDYQVPDPIGAIVHSSALDRYKMVFSLLFRLKKIEFTLNYTWRQSATLQHALQTAAQYNGIDQSTNKGYGRATFLLRNISILRQSMTHLIVNLKSYLMFEVIEGGWQRLESAIDEATTLDEAIDAHDRYLDDNVRKSMLRDEERVDYIQQHLAHEVDVVLAITDSFCSLQERLFNDALRSADIAAEKRIEAESRLSKGQWGFGSDKDRAEQETFFGLANSTVLENVLRISEDYNDHALELLRALNDKVNGSTNEFAENDANLENGGELNDRLNAAYRDDDLDPQRFLIAQLDHNHFYATQVGM
jgi:gamma-tubulin complex component 3